VGSGFTAGPERTLLERSFLRYVVGQFTAPDGEIIERDIVRHAGAVVVVPLDGDDVVLVRQYRAALDAELLEVPAGKRDVPGEPSIETAARELAEEVGLAAGVIEPLVTIATSPGFSDETAELFLATELSEVPRATEGVEEAHMEIVRMPLDDAVEAIVRGEIVNAATIVGLLLTAGAVRRRSASGC